MRTTIALITSVAALALPALSGCTILKSDTAECQAHGECRAEFGFGTTCGSDGFCRTEPNARCSTTYPDSTNLLYDPEMVESTIVVGILMDYSVLAQQGRRDAAKLAFTEANAESGIEGKRFGLVFCNVQDSMTLPEAQKDGLTRTQAAVASAEYLRDAIGVPAIIGPSASGDTQQVFNAVQADNVLVISPSATSPSLTENSDAPVSDDAPGRLWRTAPPDSLQGAAIADDMGPLWRAAPVNSVAVIYQNDAYGNGLKDAFRAQFGGMVTELVYEDPAQISDRVTTAGTSGAEEVLFISSQAEHINRFLSGIAASPAYDGKGIFLTDAAANSTVLMMGNAARFGQVRGSRPAPPDAQDSVYTAFQVAYQSAYNASIEGLSYTAHAYDAAWLVIYGITWATYQAGGTINGTNIAKGLRRVSIGSDVLPVRPASWAMIKEAFRTGNAVNVQGASGPLDYSPESEETSAAIEIWRINENTIERIHEWTP